MWNQNRLLYLVLSCIIACVHPQVNTDANSPPTPPTDSIQQAMAAQSEATAKAMANAQITYFVIHAPDNKFGYTIFIDGQLYIEQQNIPAIEGKAGFDSKEDAEKIAQLVINKIRKGELPPTITKEELHANGITD